MKIQWIITSATLGLVLGRLGLLHGMPLQEVGLGLIAVLKVLAIPLLFFSMVDGFSQASVPWKKGLRMLGLSSLNGLTASLICLGITTIFGLEPIKSGTRGIATVRDSHLKLFFPHWMSPNPLSVAMIALLIGWWIRRGGVATQCDHLVQQGLRGSTQALRGVLKIVPIAVFCAVADWSARSGVEGIGLIAQMTAVVMMGLFIQVFVYYSVLVSILGKRSPIEFFKRISGALLVPLTTGSSLASLPTTLETLEKRLGVSSQTSRLVACMGTNLNHAGILLYEATVALMIAQAYGIALQWQQKLQILGTSAIAAIAIAGVPEAGLITLSLVLGAAHLPTELVPLLMSVDWMMGRLRASVNVASDLVVATVIHASDESLS